MLVAENCQMPVAENCQIPVAENYQIPVAAAVLTEAEKVRVIALEGAFPALEFQASAWLWKENDIVIKTI